MFDFKPGKPIGNYLCSWDYFLGCKAQFHDELVIIYRTYRKNGIKYVDVVHDDSKEVWKNVSLSTLIPLEYKDIDMIFYQDKSV